MNTNKLTSIIRTQINQQRSQAELYSDALNIFINRIVRGVYEKQHANDLVRFNEMTTEVCYG